MLVAHIYARHRVAACRDDAIDIVKPDRSTPTTVLELKPQNCSSPEGAWVRADGWSNAVVLGNACLEPNCLEIKHWDAVDIKVVAAEKLDRGETGEDQVGRCKPRVRRIDDICRRTVLDHVERCVLAIQSCLWKCVEVGSAQAGARCAWIELCHIVKNGEGSSGAGNRWITSRSRGGAGIVLNAMADGNLLEDCRWRWCGKL